MPTPSVAVVRTIGGFQASWSGRQFDGGSDFGFEAIGAVAFGFVQNENVGHFHQACFHALHVVAQTGHDKDERAIGQAHDVDLVLAHANSLDQYNLLARGVENQRHIGRGPG